MDGRSPLPALDQPRPAWDRWADRLRCWFPLGGLLDRPARRDPLRGLALPDGELQEDTSMLAAYYLSFYE